MLEPGTLVVCKYRMPSSIQPWLGEIHVGVVEEASSDSNPWDSRWKITEKEYCETCGKTRVKYHWGTMYDQTSDLIPITQEQADLSHKEKVRLFLGEEAYANFR
jgi:hypothetical protein